MKMRTARTAGLVGGLATGALLLAGTAAQAADTDAEASAGDLVAATPEALGGLPVSPDAVTGMASGVTGGVADKVPGLNAIPGLDALPVDAVPGLDALAPSGPDAEARGNAGQDAPSGSPLDALPVGDLLSGLGGGLPVPLPF